MGDVIESFLHPQIMTHCMPRYRDGHFKDAVREARSLVDQALQEKSGVTHRPDGNPLFGRGLVAAVFGPGSGIKLRHPFGGTMQDAAKKYFDGAYGFYLHYATHHGDEIDGPVCLRALVVASDLLFLVGASRLSFERVGGVKGLVERGVFPSRDAILALLSFLDGPDHGGYCLPNEICDGYYEDLGKMDLEAKHLQAVIDVGLIEYWVDRNVSDPDGLTESVGIFHLTRLGESVLKSGSS